MSRPESELRFTELRSLAAELARRIDEWEAAVATSRAAEQAEAVAADNLDAARRDYDNYLSSFGVVVREEMRTLRRRGQA